MAHENNSIKSLDECKTRTFPREVFKSSLFPCRNVTVEIVHRCRSWVKKKSSKCYFQHGRNMRDNPFHNTKKRGKMTVKPLHRIQCRKSNRTGGGGKVFSGFIRPAMKRKERSTNRCRRRSSCQQNNRIKTVRLKNTHIHTQRQNH